MSSITQLQKMQRRVLAAMGVLCVLLGAIGIVVPGLPTTVFLLLAAYLFARSSRRMHAWLYESRVLGGYLRAAHERRMPTRAKVVSLVAMWTGVTFALFRLPGNPLVLGSMLIVAAIVGTIVICRMRGASTAPARVLNPS